MGLVILLQTSPRSAEAVVERLQAEGIDASVLDRPNPIVFLISFGTYRVRVAVPEEQEGDAHALLERHEPEAQARIRELAQEVRRHFLLAAAPALLAMGGLVFAAGVSPLASFLVGSLVGFAVFVALGLRARRSAEAP